jgi:ACS family sodium-dependent inorganic phosphate cotransporter-like MFS transporter 5
LGAFFYGYLISQVPGGLLAEHFGAKWIIAGFLGLSTVATLLTPIASHTSFVLLIILRILCGIGSGALFPAMHAMLGQWAPPMERSKLCGLVMAGTMMGNVITMPVAGVLCEYGFGEGWDSVFYVIGITSTITIVFWIFITSNTPATHPRISKAEREYIVNSLKGELVEDSPTLCQMPWGKIMMSGPVWALILANFCVDWGLYTYLTNIPTFFNEVLYFDIKSNGLFSALPFLGLWASCNICPVIADKLRASNVMSTANVRKLFNTVGMVGAAVVLIGLSFLDCTQTALAVALLVIAVAISGCVYSGYYVNHMDIAPQYAGTLMGIANGIAAASGFIAPYIASVVTKDQTRESWQIVFFIAAGVYTFGAIMYCVLGRGTLQPWARDMSRDIYEIEAINVKVNGANGIDGESHGPIYKPKSSSNGELATDPMLENKF